MSIGLTKETNILVSEEPYVTQAHEVNLGIVTSDPEVPDNSRTLEVSDNQFVIFL